MNRPILIIEDDPDIAEVLAYALQKEQFVTRVALTGEDGLAASLDPSNPPAIILLDLLLPGMTGKEIWSRGYSANLFLITSSRRLLICKLAEHSIEVRFSFVLMRFASARQIQHR